MANLATQRDSTDISDVIIVGYGPVGQVLSILLGQLGLKVKIVERWRTLYHLPRAVHYDHEAARIFQQLGVGNEMASIAYSEIDMEFHNARRELLMRQGDHGLGMSGWPPSNMFYQPEMEAILDARSRALPSVSRLLGWRATQVIEQPSQDVVRVSVSEEGGTEATELLARFVVGCDGANSLVRTVIGCEEVDLGVSQDWLVVTAAMVRGEVGSTGVQLCDPYRPQTFVPAGPRRIRLEFKLRPEEIASAMNRPEAAWSLMKPWGFTPDNVEMERHAVYTFSAKWCMQWQRGRVFLAGDAAHQMPPFLGQGMCAGLKDAISLAWRLGLVLRGIASERLLDTYASERVPYLRNIITKTVEIGSVLCITDPEAAAARDAAMLATKDDVPLVFSWPLGPGALRSGDPAAGHLSLQTTVRHQGRSGLLDDVIPASFRLIASVSCTGLLSPQNATFFETIGGQIVSFAEDYEDPTGASLQWLQGLSAVAVLVRPDFYNFGCAATTADIDALIGDLRRIVEAAA